MKAIVDKNGNIYNRFDRTNEIEYIKKDYNYMPVTALPGRPITKSFWDNLYAIDSLDLKQPVINVNKSHTFNFTK